MVLEVWLYLRSQSLQNGCESIAHVRVRVTVLTYRAGPVSAPVVSTTTAKALRSLCTTI